METNLSQLGVPDLQSLFESLTPRNNARGLGAFGGLPRLAEALGVGPEGPGAAGLGGVPGLVDALSLSSESEAVGDTSLFQLVSLQLNVSIATATGVSVPIEEALPGDAPTSVEDTAERIVSFATGLFGAFAAQNPELSEAEAFAQFETVVRDAIGEGIAEAEQILEGLGELDEGTQSLITDIRSAIDVRLDAFFSAPETGETEGASTPVAVVDEPLPTAGEFGIISIEQVNVSVSLQVAQARIEARGAEALGNDAPVSPLVNFEDESGFDELVGNLVSLADDLFNRLLSGDDVFGQDGVQGLIDQVLDIFGQGFDDAFSILDDFGVGTLPDGQSPSGVFQLAYDSVELNISQIRIETEDGLVIEQTTVSLRVVQVRIQGVVGDSLAPGQDIQPIPVPESPEDVAQNVLDFASGLFGLFRGQNPEVDDQHALADFVALVRDAAAQGADEARDLLEALDELHEDQGTLIDQVLADLDTLLAERFPSVPLLS